MVKKRLAATSMGMELSPSSETLGWSIAGEPMTTHDLLMLVLMLSPGILLSVAIMATFAAGG